MHRGPGGTEPLAFHFLDSSILEEIDPPPPRRGQANESERHAISNEKGGILGDSVDAAAGIVRPGRPV